MTGPGTATARTAALLFLISSLLVPPHGALASAATRAPARPVAGDPTPSPGAPRFGNTGPQGGGPPVGVDLDVTFINRSPLYRAYCVEYGWDVLNQPGIPRLCPGSENDRRWPAPGEPVTFTAHIANKGTAASPGFGYAWHIDGVEVARGALPPLVPGAEITASYGWPWGHELSADGQRALGIHTVRFTADPDNAVAETHESNNTLEDRTNAMSFSLSLTPEMRRAYDVPVDPRWPWSAEDWLQKQIAAMNAAFASSVYPVTPQGSALRVRIDTIGAAAAEPAPDGQHDGGWFLRDDVRNQGGYYDPATDIDWGLVHELSHQVSIIDMYALGVYGSNVLVLDRDGEPANMGFGWDGGGIMFGGDTAPHTDPHIYDSTSAGGASTYAGYRNGYYGSYLFDIPLHNTLRILDSQGNPAAGVAVMLYQRTGPLDGGAGHMGVDNTPEMAGMTDAGGLFELPNRPANGGTVTANGHVLRDNPFGVVDIIGNQGLLLVRLSRGDHEEFHWLDITQFNRAFWAGDVRRHIYTIASHLPPAGAPQPPEVTGLQVEGTRVRLQWKPGASDGVIGYRVYRAAAPRYRYAAAGGLLSTTHFEEDAAGLGDGGHRIYAVTAVDAGGRESGFGDLAYAPALGAPLSVALTPDGDRLVLNSGNLYPLLRQRADGRYTHRVVNVHYDLWNARGLAVDASGEVLIGGFGESRSGRRGVRLYDAAMEPLLAFGEEGSAPGQLLAPAGMARLGRPWSYGGPYQPDPHTLLLLHLDGSFAGSQGEPGAAQGATFAPGRHGLGAAIGQGDTLSYVAAGNIDAAQGAVEFWLRPAWDGDDGGNHTLFWWGEGAEFLHLRKDGISNLVFDRFYVGGSCGAPHGVADWRAGEWHHLAFAWQGAEMRLYEDGREVARTQCGGVARPAGDHFFIGSGPGGHQAVDAVIDELRISDVQRIGDSNSSGAFLVVDSGNDRVQAFDGLGNPLSAYGATGSGPGQFRDPQGLVVDAASRVIVADRGNDRVVALGFDERKFDYLRSYEAGFNAPSGVAAGAGGRLVVADTGNDRVVVLDAAGGVESVFTAPDDGHTGDFRAPQGVAVEPDGDLVVADTGNRRVVAVRRALPGQWRRWIPVLAGG